MENILQCLPAIPNRHYRGIKGECQHLQVVYSRLEGQPVHRLLFIVIILVEHHKEHIKYGIFEISPSLEDVVLIFKSHLTIEFLLLLHRIYRIYFD